MARILLAPGEVFSHRHPSVSTTELVAGVVQLRIDGQSETALAIGIPVQIPKETEHTIINVGTEQAVLSCGLCAENDSVDSEPADA